MEPIKRPVSAFEILAQNTREGARKAYEAVFGHAPPDEWPEDFKEPQKGADI